jgi:uncharacterized protein YndB with AHSA1/START domain/DNA-binding transcriptional ArsR family regulator
MLAIGEDRLTETFAALANPTRRAILERLAQGAANVNELAEPFELSLPAISKHIKVLERAGLIVRGQRAQYRPCTLDAAPLEEISGWAEHYRPIWEARFDRLDDYVQQLQHDKGQVQTVTDENDVKNVMIERSFDAPPDLIWRMWTESEHFAAWYGPTGATIPVAKMDVRVGGSRLVCMEMQTPNGAIQMWFTGEYLEVVENQRLVYTESMCDESGNLMSAADMGMPEGHPMTTEVVVELEQIGTGTKMVMTHVGVPADSPGGAGWTMALDKLTIHVESQTT